MERILLRGDLATSRADMTMMTLEDGWIAVEGDRITYTGKEKPEERKGDTVIDRKGCLVIPGFSDMHLHAPQYQFTGLYMDEELIEWLERHTFPEESKYADTGYAEKAYRIFAEDLRKSETTRVAVFGTVHTDSCLILARLLEENGLSGYVGKVNMDRNCPDSLKEDTDKSFSETVRFIDGMSTLKRIRPIITPRFIPACSDTLLERLGRIAKDRGIPVQSHLDENISEIEWVRQLCPDAASYADAYAKAGLMDTPSIMAHVVWPEDDEIDLMLEKGTYVAHSPSSNANLSSGIAPVRRFLDRGVNIGLASDVAGGSSLSMFRIMTDAIQASKLRWRIQDSSLRPLSFEEAFHIATMGGGSFFGKTGALIPGYEADILVIDDRDARTVLRDGLSIRERLEFYSYRTPGDRIISKIARGSVVF
ncbi:MAG: amidohydrolase family protein [Candidatus Ornithospirochaeta sp.]|nr:amidohydrolase family protein [Candidatus Ornithospirochaeta sp.]